MLLVYKLYVVSVLLALLLKKCLLSCVYGLYKQGVHQKFRGYEAILEDEKMLVAKLLASPEENIYIARAERHDAWRAEAAPSPPASPVRGGDIQLKEEIDEKTGSDESAASDSSSSSSSTKGAKRRRLLNMALTNLESLQRNLQEVHSDCHDCSRLIVQTINAIKEAI